MQPQDSGIYVCDVNEPQSGQSTQTSASLMVSSSGSSSSVEESGASVDSEPLRLEVSPSVANLVQGRDAEFTCKAYGGARNPSVTWKRVSDTLDPQRHVVRGDQLLIRDVQPSDRGYFECEAQSGAESKQAYVRVEVEAREAPKLEIYPQQERLEVEYGSGAYAQCRVVAGIPTPDIEWRRADGRGLSRNVAVQQDGSLLEVKNADEGDFGTYECVAKNDAGQAVGRITLVSRGSRPENNNNYPYPERPEEENRGDQDDTAIRPCKFLTIIYTQRTF